MVAAGSVPAYMLPGVPVHQPSHLEGDSSLATEILPGPPPVTSIQQSILKRDPKKPSVVFSYLPPSDPGSTYSGLVHGTLIGHEPEAARLKRSKAAIGRAQRASARQQNGSASTLDPSVTAEAAGDATSVPISPPGVVDLDSPVMAVDDVSLISHSKPTQALENGTSISSNSRPKRKDKGKGKEVDSGAVRVKEEPKSVALLPPTDPQAVNLGNNDDHCSSCRSFGALVYCDGCPRAFHLWCLDPPMESIDEGDSRWFCPACTVKKHPPRKPPPSLLSPLIHQVNTSIPTEFQLPDDIRNHFKDVGTGPKGTYVDTSEVRPPRVNRHGEQEGRDPRRLRDRNGAPILCFRCGTSALPEGLAAVAPAAKRARRSSTTTRSGSTSSNNEAWKDIVSCDYCNLHWHLDCLDPPLPSLPSINKKWMCPNHADRILLPKRRIPKQGTTPIEVSKPGQFNNGNIDIIRPETGRPAVIVPKVPVDEVLINGRRYRIPERVIVLDFWNKLNISDAHEKESNFESGVSSPLTSLSSLDHIDDSPLLDAPPDDLRVAQLLCNLQSWRGLGSQKRSHSFTNVREADKRVTEACVQTEPEASSNGLRGRIVKLPKSTSTPKAKTSAPKPTTSGPARAIKASESITSVNDVQPPSTKKRRAGAPGPQPEPSTRELRSRSRNNVDSSQTSISTRSSRRRTDESPSLDTPISATAPPSTTTLTGSSGTNRPRQIIVKVEEPENLLSLAPFETGSSSQTPSKIRVAARGSDSSLAVETGKEKRGRKRKQRDDELTGPDTQGHKTPEEKKVTSKRGRKAKVDKKASQAPATPSVVFTSPPTPRLGVQNTPTTPSLKIRLPRMTAGGSAAVTNANGDTPSKF